MGHTLATGKARNKKPRSPRTKRQPKGRKPRARAHNARPSPKTALFSYTHRTCNAFADRSASELPPATTLANAHSDVLDPGTSEASPSSVVQNLWERSDEPRGLDEPSDQAEGAAGPHERREPPAAPTGTATSLDEKHCNTTSIVCLDPLADGLHRNVAATVFLHRRVAIPKVYIDNSSRLRIAGRITRRRWRPRQRRCKRTRSRHTPPYQCRYRCPRRRSLQPSLLRPRSPRTNRRPSWPPTRGCTT